MQTASALDHGLCGELEVLVKNVALPFPPQSSTTVDVQKARPSARSSQIMEIVGSQ